METAPRGICEGTRTGNTTTTTATATIPSNSLAPTPRSSTSGSCLSVSVNFQPRLEDPSLTEILRPNIHRHPTATRSGDNDGGVTPSTAASTQEGVCTTTVAVAAAAPSPLSTSHKTTKTQDRHRSSSGSNRLPPATLRLTFPDCETTGSNQYFLSEPSLSPDDDDSRIRAPHRLPSRGARVFRHQLSSDEDGNLPNNLPRLPHASHVPSSPGNTSLSSWDSPNRSKKRVLLQFTPQMSTETLPHALIEINGIQQTATTRPQARSPDLSSPAYTHPETRGKQYDVTEGNSSELNVSFTSGFEQSVLMPALSEMQPIASEISGHVGRSEESPDSFQRMIDGLKDQDSISDSLVFDQSVLAADHGPSPLQTQTKTTMNRHHHNIADESIIMDLSDSEDDFDRSDIHLPIKSADDHQQTHPSRTSTFDSEYMQDQAADDEKTASNSEQLDVDKKTQYSRQTPIVRARSGDAAAASLATGGREWKGMRMDNIPLPDQEDEEEEDGEDSKPQQAQPSLSNNLTSQGTELATTCSVENDSSNSDENIGVAAVKQPRRTPKSQFPQQQQQQQPRRPSLTRPPKPEPKGLVTPTLQVVAPPPQIGASYGLYSDSSQFPHHPSNGFPKHIPPSPSAPPYHAAQRSPHLSSHNMWTQATHPQRMSYRDLFVSQNHTQSGTFDLPPRWDSNSRSIGESSYDERERSGSWEPSPVANVADGMDRRRAWSSERSHASLRSSQGINPDHGNLHENHHRDRVSHQDASSGALGKEGVESVEEDDVFDEGRPMSRNEKDVMREAQLSAERIELLEQQFEDRNFRDAYQTVMRTRNRPPLSPFANIGKKQDGAFNRASFYPITSLAQEDEKKYPTFICPRCKTRQRAFFDVSNAPKQLQEPTGYLAAYFVLYVTASLFIFGLEEGWEPLDCIYFAVISLTTAGLGDFYPTTDANKIICSIFIYFGIACIGLLLGSYIASMLDDKEKIDAKAIQVDSCPNCARINNLKDATERSIKKEIEILLPNRFSTERVGTPTSGCSPAVYKPRRKHHQVRHHLHKKHEGSQHHDHQHKV